MPRKRDDDEEEGRFEEEASPPSRRKRDKKRDEEDEEDRPRSKRRRGEEDDEEEDRPRSKRRRDEEDDEDENEDRPRSIRKKGKLDRASLRSVAIYQKGILVAILVYCFVVGIQFVMPPELRWILGLAVALPTVITATVFVFLLSIKVYSPVVGVLLAILTLIPCVGLIILLIINAQATSILRRHGISVGLLGARLSDLD